MEPSVAEPTVRNREGLLVANVQLVGLKGEKIVILAPRLSMTKDEALNLAAYLVALVDDEDRFLDMLGAVQGV